MLTAVGLFVRLMSNQNSYHAYAYTEDVTQNLDETKTLFSGDAMEIMKSKSDKPSQSSIVEQELYRMVGEAPIKDMIPFVASKDRTVAALIIGIAKKESNFGNASPLKDGKDCYNYWGYKGAGSRGTSMGYGCFASPEEGVEIIGNRITELVNKDLNTPSKMIVWKCGSTCKGHDPVSVKKWISDVEMYFAKIIAIES